MMALDKSMPILIVDDYATMVRIIRNLLKQLGFKNVDDATDGKAALENAAKNYGLVISDWNMEPMTGYDLVRQCAPIRRSQDPLYHGHGQVQGRQVVAAKKAGVNNYIVKPFNAETLQNKITAVFPDAPSPCPPPPDGYQASRRITAFG